MIVVDLLLSVLVLAVHTGISGSALETELVRAQLSVPTCGLIILLNLLGWYIIVSHQENRFNQAGLRARNNTLSSPDANRAGSQACKASESADRQRLKPAVVSVPCCGAVPSNLAAVKTHPATTATDAKSAGAPPQSPVTPIQGFDVSHLALTSSNSYKPLAGVPDTDLQPLAELRELGLKLSNLRSMHLFEVHHLVGAVQGTLLKLTDQEGAMMLLGTTWPAQKWMLCRNMVEVERELRSLLKSLQEFKPTADMDSREVHFQLRTKLSKAEQVLSDLSLDLQHLKQGTAEAGLPSWPDAVAPLVTQIKMVFLDLGHQQLDIVNTQVSRITPQGWGSQHVLQQHRWSVKKAVELMQELQSFGGGFDAVNDVA